MSKAIISKMLSAKYVVHNILYVDKHEENNREKIQDIFNMQYKPHYENMDIGEYTVTDMPSKIFTIDEEDGQENQVYYLHQSYYILDLKNTNYKGVLATLSSMSINSRMDREKCRELDVEYLFLTTYYSRQSFKSMYVKEGSYVNDAWAGYYFSHLHKTQIPVLCVCPSKTYLRKYFQYSQDLTTMGGQEIKIGIYNNVVDAVNDNVSTWYAIWPAYPYTDVYRRSVGLKDEPIYADLIKNTVIFSDNINGFNSIKNELYSSPVLFDNYPYIYVNQYHLWLNQLVDISQYNYGHPDGILTLGLLNHSRITELCFNNTITGPNSKIEINMKYPLTNGTLNHMWVSCQCRSGHIGSGSVAWAVPYMKDKDYHIKAIKFLRDLHTLGDINGSGSAAIAQRLVNNYYNYCLLGKEKEEELHGDDVLDTWFSSCVSNSYKEQEQLKQAYINLKKNLEREYKETTLYLKNTDLSKMKPIPSLTLSKDIHRNVEKHISFRMDERKFSQLNGRHLTKTITDVTPVINWVLKRTKHEPMFIVTRMEDFYDTKNNCLNLNGEKARQQIGKELW